jgi:hypothetical protein
MAAFGADQLPGEAVPEVHAESILRSVLPQRIARHPELPQARLFSLIDFTALA